MLIQIPYSLDELVATTEFLWRRKSKVAIATYFLCGDTDTGAWEGDEREFEQGPITVLKT